MGSLLSILVVLAAPAGDVSRGRTLFEARCGLCHSIGPEHKEGPGLGGVVGREAGSTDFSYTRALKESHLRWDAATLDRFLSGPKVLVPGTAMTIVQSDPDDRAALIAFLATLPAGGTSGPRVTAATARGPRPAHGPGVRQGIAAFGDYVDDAPGVRRRFTLDALPEPFATASAARGPQVVARPEGAHLAAPPGFAVDEYAHDLPGARRLLVAPNGDLFVAQSTAGRIAVLRAGVGAAHPELTRTFAADLDRPFGMAFYPPGPSPRWLYVAENNRVVRFPYSSGDLAASGEPQVIVPRLMPTGSGGHWTRDLIFSPDGQRMFVSVGSGSNIANGMSAAPEGGLEAWRASHALGAAWGTEEGRADVRAFDPEGHGDRVFATGLRNCVGLGVEPRTGELWCSVNERDGLGDDLVNDYLTRVREGAFYGWPWFYLGAHEDPRLAKARPDLASKVTVPDVLVQPHSAALGFTFLSGTQFPAEYRGDAFAAFHGSWNRSQRTGYKIERVRLREGVPTGEVEDFVTGFVVDGESVWGRPVGVATLPDGSLVFSEDGHGTLWRVRYAPGAGPR